MIENGQNSPIMRWIEVNKEKINFSDALNSLLSFACADWIRRGSGRIVAPESALAMVVAADIPEFPLGTWLDDPSVNSIKIAEFCEKIKYLPLPASLQADFPKMLDLRGVTCPRNAARSRLVLSGAPEGARLEICLDEGSPIENVPQALIADGHIVEKREKKGNFWVIYVVKGAARV